MAISKKALGNRGNYYEVFKKWLPKDEEIKEEDSMIVYGNDVEFEEVQEPKVAD